MARKKCANRESKTPIHQHTFSGQVEQLPSLTRFVAEATRALGGDDELIAAFRLAADEAAANAFEHAYQGRPGRMDVEVSREGNRLVVVLRHWGRTFDPEAISEPDPAQPLEERTPGGWGLFLMRKVMDDVTFQSDARKGHTVIMSRRIGIGELCEGGRS